MEYLPSQTKAVGRGSDGRSKTSEGCNKKVLSVISRNALLL